MSSNKYWKKGKKVRKQQLNVSVLKREYCAVGNYTQINRRCKMDLYVTLCKAEWYYRIFLSSEVSMGLWEWLGYSLVRKHLTRGFQCAVLDLSGTLWPLLIPEYSGIKRRGTPFRGLRNPGISYYGDKYPLPFYEPDGKKVIVCSSLFDRDRGGPAELTFLPWLLRPSQRRTAPSPTREGAWCLHAAARALRTGLYWLSV